MQQEDPSITKEFITSFIEQNQLKLKATQDTISLPIVNRLYKKMLAGLRFPDIKVCDELIIDGHHRYLASLLAEYNGLEHAPSHQSNATEIVEWESINFTIVDHDTPESIDAFDKQDAMYNETTLEKLREIIK